MSVEFFFFFPRMRRPEEPGNRIPNGDNAKENHADGRHSGAHFRRNPIFDLGQLFSQWPGDIFASAGPYPATGGTSKSVIQNS